MECRPLTRDDFPALIHLGARAHEESEYSLLTFSPEKCLQLFESSLVNPDVLIVVAVLDGVLVGVLGAGVYAPYFSEERVSGDLLVYVAPEYRGTMAFIKLVSQYVTWAKEHGAKLIFLRSSTGIEPEKTEKLYTKLGFINVGGNFVMEVR